MANSQSGPPPGPPWDLPLARAPLAFLDLEMTGLDVRVDRVIEICLERWVGDELTHKLCTLVQPDDGRFGNQHVHGIAQADLAGAVAFREIAGRTLDLLEGAVLVAHGAASDVAFLEAELRRAGREQRLGHVVDTLTLSRRVFGFRSHALAALSRELGHAPATSHRAEADVAALRFVFSRVVTQIKPTSVRDLWHVKVGARVARPEILAALGAACGSELPVTVRYRPAGKAAADLSFVVTGLRSDLDPPQVLGYLHPGRGRRVLRADRIISVSS